ncbi:MAG: carboxypeptidase regulatory-like domain-containing protein, partial [Planctomycetes bacterium]|nr:carboxypeptidase regulatory-like domain-containing protein [Planctomycetota bacterium]
MIGAHYALVIGLAISGQTHSDAGAISGIVVNASQGGVPAAHAEVVLRVQVDGQFVPAAETVADAQGRFHFPDLPADAGFVYLPGANRDDVHYPGKRLRLTAARPEVDVKLKVCDSIAHPCPLVIKRQDILIRPEPGALHVTESLLVSNPTRTTYVGQAKKEAAEPVTLQLSIPSDFDRTTFHKEFFGRRFSIAGGKLVTGVPWTPGEQELKFTYTLRNEEKYRLWQRPLDLPCDNVRL